MKKLLCIVLTLCILLCGCGGTKDKQATETAPSALQERSVVLGRIENGKYTNEYVGFGCDFGSDWDLYGADELQDIPANVAEMLQGTEAGDIIEQYTQISDMMAENVEDLTTVNILYTKLGLQERLAYALMEEKDILEQVLSQQDILVDSYKAAGIYISDMELVTVSFLGETRYAIHTTATMQEVPYYILQIYEYHLGAYGVVTTFASFIEDNTASLPAMFYSIG